MESQYDRARCKVPATCDLGLHRHSWAKALLSRLVGAPYQSAWLLLGPTGLGKTTIALAAQTAIGGELHHVRSADCTIETVNRLAANCYYSPWGGGRWHFNLIDEADKMSPAAQTAFLSILDTASFPPDSIWCFTANSTKLLQDRFLGRVRTLHFAPPDTNELSSLLKKVWKTETRHLKRAPAPDFGAIARESNGIRHALMQLETELLVPGSFIPAPISQLPTILPATKDAGKSSNNHGEPIEISELKQRRSDAAKRAWLLSPKLQAMRKRA